MKIPYRFPFSPTLLLIGLTMGCSNPGSPSVINSPSQTVTVSVYADSSSRLTYAVQYRGKMIVAPSALGITIDQRDLGQHVKIGSPVITETNEQYPWKGVHATAHNHYREAVFPVTNSDGGIRYQLELKVFDDGMAWRYVVPSTKVSVVRGEASSWKIPEGSTVWYQENIFYYEGLYYSSPLDKLGSKKMGPPLTYQTKDGLYASITEAALYDYSGMCLQSDGTGLLHAAFVNDPQGWKIQDTVVTPWRVVITGETLNQLVNSDIIPDLNPAPDSSLQQATWIKPGRAVWSYFMHDNVTSLGLEKSYADKAGLLGFEYSVVDAGWEQSWPASMDSLKALVDYARPKRVGIWVWKSYPSLKDDSIRQHFFKALHDAGVAGVKIDFIDTEGIRQVRFYKNALQDAAKEKLMIDFHGADKPTGYNRSFPNELTREAIYGQEWRTYNPQGPANNASIPFTRFLAGPGDCTPGVFDSKKAYGTSRAQQLALPIIFNSPLACWPADPDLYLRSAALPVIRAIPTIWDETRVLEPSRIGRLAAFARRKGNNWFVAVANAGDEKSIPISLNFLNDGKYTAEIIQDDLADPDHIFYSQNVFQRTDSLLIVMRPAGGYVALFRKTGEDAPGLSIFPQGGYLYGPTRVNMKTKSGLIVRYTTNGSTPTSQSTQYTNPVILKNPALVRAMAFDHDKAVAASGTAQFLGAPGPTLSHPGGIFMNQLTLYLQPADQTGDIYFTTNGSEPSIHSTRCRDSLKLTKTTRLRAKTFYANGSRSSTTSADFIRVTPAPAISVLHKTPGLLASYYEGEWKKMPNFNKILRIRSSTVAIPDLGLLQTRQDNYAVRFSGYLNIPATGIYTFYINSDDGSQLYLDDQQLVDNDGCHGDLEKSGEKALSAGMHRFSVNYFQSTSGQTLQVSIQGPGLVKQIIPASMFCYNGE